jgi:creatinine amidohydrolase/Fe(II)-dependent formamide hydrolase-like protein
VLSYVPEGDVDRREGHMAYPGTISVPDGVFAAVVEAAAASFKAHGFKMIVLLGDSGGNQAPQRAVAAKLGKAWAKDGVSVLNADAYYAANGGEALLRDEGETPATIGTHAGIRDTSELLAVLPSGVDLARARADAEGATGNAARATRERGERLLALKVETAVAEIRKARQTAARPRQTGLLDRLWR